MQGEFQGEREPGISEGCVQRRLGGKNRQSALDDILWRAGQAYSHGELSVKKLPVPSWLALVW